MKTAKIIFYCVCTMLSIIVSNIYAQDKPESIVSKFFPAYVNEKGYRNTSVTEDMIKNIRKQGVWGNPKFDLFMSQMKLTQHASFDIADESRLKAVEAQMKNKIENSHTYKLFTSSEKNDGATYIYTLTNEHKVIVEVAILTVSLQMHRINGASFLGDNINLDAVKAFAGEGH